MEAMIVVTAKRDGGTQDVMGFYHVDELVAATAKTIEFLGDSKDCRRAIVRIELYNPRGHAAPLLPTRSSIPPDDDPSEWGEDRTGND